MFSAPLLLLTLSLQICMCEIRFDMLLHSLLLDTLHELVLVINFEMLLHSSLQDKLYELVLAHHISNSIATAVWHVPFTP